MRIRDTLGVANPILLPKNAYGGEELCGVCHDQPHETWLMTKHAFAFDTLVEHGADLRVGAFLPEVDPHLGMRVGAVYCVLAGKRPNRHEVNSA